MHGLLLDQRKIKLLDFTFFIVDVLANNWIILFDNHLFGHRTCVLFCYIKVPGPRGGVQADFDGGRLRHGSSLRNAAQTACG